LLKPKFNLKKTEDKQCKFIHWQDLTQTKLLKPGIKEKRGFPNGAIQKRL
jgi:hypothetical protein